MRVLTRLLPPEVGRPLEGLAPVVACGGGAGLVVVAQAALLSRVVDGAFLGGASLETLAPALLALAACAAVRAGLIWRQEVLAQRVSARVRLAVRDRLARRLLALGPRYAAGERTGELANTLGGGVESLDAYVAQYLPQAALAVIGPAVVLAGVGSTDPLSALVLLATLPLVPLFMWLVGSAAEARTRRQWTALSRLAARFHDALSGLATLRAFGRAADEARVLEQAGERHRKLTLEVLRLALVSALVQEALATLGTAVVAVEVGLRLLYARLAFGDALFVLVLVPEFYRPLRALGASYHAGMAGREAALRMGEILEARGPLAAPGVLAEAASAAPPPPAAAATAAGPPRIRFESVRAVHEGARRAALDNFSLEIPAGETVALVGPTGAGKTTAAHLLLRFQEPAAGRILVGDVPLAEVAPEAWRRAVAWVPQRPRLFHATLRENLLLSRPDARADDLERAVRLARLEELVRELPRGLETELGEGGARLSGGEAQRVALARAFLKDAPVVVLDEPTSHLDLSTEAEVLEGILELGRGRTVLLVAHRLTALAAASRVALLAEGRVVEEGAPRALAASGAVYPRLVAAWDGTS